jgi:hypothetical protein
MSQLLARPILFCDDWAIITCDGRCDKAWGMQNRPKRMLSADPDDYVYLADDDPMIGQTPNSSELGSEGDEEKPSDSALQAKYSYLMNRWCARACERATMLTDVVVCDMANPRPNKHSRLLGRQKKTP